MTSSSRQPRVWLVTGCSSGFGRNIITHILDSGDIAIATLRSPARLSSTLSHPNLLILELDVTSPSQIASVFDIIKQKYGRLDVVVNNAGTLVYGEVEGTSEEEGRKLFEVNFWGSTRITLKALEVFRGQKTGGKVLQVSSKTGARAIAGMGVYSASKFALEGWYEALADEMDPAWNIQISLILPGRFWTSVRENCVSLPPHLAYSSPNLPTNKTRKDLQVPPNNTWGDPMKAAKAIVEVGQREKLPFRVFLGKDCQTLIEKKIDEYKRDLEEGRELGSDMYSEGLGGDS